MRLAVSIRGLGTAAIRRLAAHIERRVLDEAQKRQASRLQAPRDPGTEE